MSIWQDFITEGGRHHRIPDDGVVGLERAFYPEHVGHGLRRSESKALTKTVAQVKNSRRSFSGEDLFVLVFIFRLTHKLPIVVAGEFIDSLNQFGKRCRDIHRVHTKIFARSK
jgi:hypothetical protein